MKKSISSDQTESNIREVMKLLSEMPTKLEALTKDLTNEQRQAPLGHGDRTPTEILAHILHCEALTSEALILALLKDEPLLPDIHAERELGKLLRLDMLSFDELLTYYKVRRTILMRVLEPLTEKKWSRVVREEKKARKESVYWQARTQALHELEHLLDLESKLQSKS